MSLAELLFLLLSKRKSLLKFALGSSIAYGAYAGAIRPSIGNSVIKVDGSNVLQGKFKDSLKLAKAPITQVQNALELDSLRELEQNKHRFHPSLFKYLNKKSISEKQQWSGWDLNIQGLREAKESAKFCRSCGTFSDKEIIYGESYFSERVAEFEESELVQDILWSLWEESRYSGTLIHADTIKVDLQIDRSNRVPEVRQFSLSLKVSNLSGKKAKVFRAIELDTDSQTEINILLSNSELRPMPVAAGIQGIKYTAWNLFPKNAKWKVVKNLFQPRRQTTTENYDSLQLLYGSSRFIPYTVSKDVGTKVAVNTIDYPYIKNKLISYLNSITKDQVKQDIESWYGGYFAYLLRTRIEDIKDVIKFMQKRTIVNKEGIKESVFERFLNNYQFRNTLYYQFKFKDDYRKIVNQLLNKESKKNIAITNKEIVGTLKSWVYQLEQIQDSIKVEIIWNKEPEKVYSQSGQNAQFPHFAFSFEQKITWIKDMEIPLNGAWDTKENKYQERYKEEGDNYKFNLTNKLENIREILAPLTSTFSVWNSGLGQINVMDNLIPDVGKFIGINSLKIKKDESISYIFKTEGTPITLALDNIADLQENYYPRMNIGWKALDVISSLNLSNFTNLFYSLYQKFDLGVKDKDPLGVSQLLDAKKELINSPISFIVHGINSIFDESYGLGQAAKRQDEKNRPWPVFFQTLFSDALTFQHSQMMVGYSKLFFKYPEWWGKENKTKNSKCKSSSSSSDHWCTDFDFTSNKEAIATPINDEIDLISKSLLFNYSMYMPDAPIVLDGFSDGEQYRSFLGKNGRGSSSKGLLNSEKEIIEAVRRDYEENIKSFEGKKVMNWDNAKVSFAQLNLKKAINSVLALKNTWSGLGSNILLSFVGLEFHNILGEALIRDGFWININLMHEYGLFTRHDFKVTKTMSYFPNSEIWLKATPILDRQKLNLGLLKSWIN